MTRSERLGDAKLSRRPHAESVLAKLRRVDCSRRIVGLAIFISRFNARSPVPMDKYVTDGALFRIAPPAPGAALPAVQRVLGELAFANSIVIDEKRGQLFLSDTMADQVTGYRISVADGTLSDRRVVASVLTPDNIEMDEGGLLWAASPVGNEVVTINPETGETRSVFRAQTSANDRSSAEWRRRSKAREPRTDLFIPDVWAPMPGLVTGVILTPGGGPVYVSGLADALLKLEP